MKEQYKRPTIANSDLLENPTGVLPILGALIAGYAATRKITQAVKASPLTKLQGLSHRHSN